MNGYTGISLSALRKDEREIYRSVRCSLCHAIKSSCGLMYTPCLSNDMVSLLILKLSLQENDVPTYRGSCSASAFLRVPFYDYLDPFFVRAAHICVSIACEELADDVRDRPTSARKVLHRIVERKVCREATQQLRTLASIACFNRMEADARASFDDLLSASGDIALAVACDLYDCEREALPDGLAVVVHSLGKWVYLLDACDDWHVDTIRGSNNPLTLLGSPMEAGQVIRNVEAAIVDGLHALGLTRNRRLVEDVLCNNLRCKSASVLRKLEGEVACQ